MIETLFRSPQRLVLALILLQTVLWSLVLVIFNHNLPLDVVREGLSWGHEWQLGYFKHPPLPSLLVNAFYVVFGDFGPYLLGQLCIGVTYYFVFRLGLEFLSPPRAALGTLVLATVYYFSWPSQEFNHNLAQMPAWAAATYYFYKGLYEGGYRWWVGVGVAFGLGILSKYTMAVLGIAMILFMVADPALRRRIISLETLLAGLVCIILVAPHLMWLIENDFLPLRYMSSRGGQAEDILQRFIGPLKFLITQALDHGVFFLVIAGGGLLSKTAWSTRQTYRSSAASFLLTMGFGPALLAALWAVSSGTGLRDMWGAPFWNLSGLIALYFLGAQTPDARLIRMAKSSLIIVILVPVVYGIIAVANTYTDRKPSRTAWPDASMAAYFDHAWQQQTKCELEIIAGENWLTGLIAAKHPQRPSVLIDGNFLHSPWLSPQDLLEHGGLFVWHERGEGKVHGKLQPLLANFGPDRQIADPQIAEFAWPTKENYPPLKIGWVLIPPLNECGEK